MAKIILKCLPNCLTRKDGLDTTSIIRLIMWNTYHIN